ncbi:hypothetical protein E2C01_039093 [Portunus trituberculatus]|uniref:Uncharacterized protein n=1 Tax=Portunus trituberculatus TaxID=210409 RepID=A0A5B7FIQ5_PORTR|nr:hypothetical protein [Portunus trituberculatus]
MYRVDGPQPFSLTVSDVNHHHSYRAPEDEGEAALHFFRNCRSTRDGCDNIIRSLHVKNPHHKKPNPRQGVTAGPTETIGTAIAERSLKDARSCAP